MRRLKLAVSGVCSGALALALLSGCSQGESCEPTSDTFCSEGVAYSVDSCGELTNVVATCDCGCNSSHTGCVTCNCTPDCYGRVCGSDGCGDVCGTCQGGQTCDGSGQCQSCTPNCTNRECGDNGCGGSCGACDSGQSCDASGQCVGGCTPDCANRQCGSDGCGGSCGSCTSPATCNASGRCEGATLSLAAQAVGAYSQSGTNCSGGAMMTGYAAFLCPGGKIRGGGYFQAATELWCGEYTVAAPVYPSCTDRLGCFPRVDAVVKDTLIYGGQEDVEYGFEFSMYLVPESGEIYLYKPTKCNDNSDGLIALQRIAVDVTDNYCHSSACPQSGGSSGGSGTCGTDCDCGHCWYCESGTCRYGGEGPYGCYRGCS
jgi:hypothetical protein